MVDPAPLALAMLTPPSWFPTILMLALDIVSVPPVPRCWANRVIPVVELPTQSALKFPETENVPPDTRAERRKNLVPTICPLTRIVPEIVHVPALAPAEKRNPVNAVTLSAKKDPLRTTEAAAFVW